MSNQLEIISKDKVQLVKDQICRGASDGELQLFIATCNRTNLDPFARQCWAVRRWDSTLGREVMTFQTGVDGFRVIANRSDKYAGQVGPFWCGADGVWKDVWLDNMPPVAAKVGVLRSDFKEPLWAVAKFHSYAGRKKDGNLTPFWFKMPELMIAKVAECLALRKAFPQDLSGIYSQEEMDQAIVEKEVPIGKPQIEAPVIQSKPQISFKKIEPTKEELEKHETCLDAIEKQNVKKEILIPEEIQTARNFASGEFEIPASCQTLHRFGKVKLVPEKNARQYLMKLKEWMTTNQKPLSSEANDLIASIKSYWGIL